MKKIIALSLLYFVACTPKSELQTTRWSGEGQRPELILNGTQLKSISVQTSSNEHVKTSQQMIDHFLIEDTFVKTISKSDGDVIFQSSSLTKAVPKSVLAEAKNLEENKAKSWILFIKKNPIYQNLKVVSDIEVTIATKPKIHPVLKVLLETDQGEFWQFSFKENGKFIAGIRQGSNLSEVSDTPALAFPKGPKKSILTTVLLTRTVQPEGLANSYLQVLSQSPAKIVNLQSLEFQPEDDRFDQIQAFYFSFEIVKWFEEKVSLKASSNFSIITQVGYPEKTNAAFYFQNQIRLGAGDDVTFSKIPWDPSIVMHETSHAVIDSLSHLPFQGEGGSLNEGFADVFTTFYLNSPLLGDNSYKLADYKRTVDQDMKLSEKTGGLYHDSAIVSGFFWALKPLITPEKTLTFAVHVLNRLGPNSDFKDFALNLREQSQTLFTGDDLQKIISLMKERELL